MKSLNKTPMPHSLPHACLNSHGDFYNSFLLSSVKAANTEKNMNDLVVFSDKVTPFIDSYGSGTLDKQMFESRLQGFIGMDYGSSLIQVLQNVNVVSSRLYSFFQGNEIMDESRDGFVTFGEYDEHMVKGFQKVTEAFN